MKTLKHGFSLIELLTVIAILSILAALLVPVVNEAKNQAHQTRCSTNLREWAIANILYADDNSGLIPWDGWDGRHNSSPSNRTIHAGTEPWFNALPPYFNSPTIEELDRSLQLPRFGDNSLFICPAAMEGDSAPEWLCYGPNYLLSSASARTTTRVKITRIDDINEPARVPLFAESTNHSEQSDSTIALNANPRYLASATRHNGRAYVSFFDGHVEAFTPEELMMQARAWDNPNFPERIRWNPLHQ